MSQDKFSFFVPMDIQKSDSDTNGEMRIRGFASTPDKDRQDDEILQNGLDISNFVDYGWFNYDHDNSKILGYPDKATTRISKDGFYVEGNLLSSVPLARELWEVAVGLAQSKAPRRLGFSVEGKTLAKDSKGRITKAMVYNVAITPNPVNPKATWEALVKSFTDPDYMGKAMEAGYNSDIGAVNSGSCLKTESLEAAFKTLARTVGGDEEASKSLSFLKETLGLSKSMDKNEMVLYLQLTKGLSRIESINIVENLIRSNKEE